MTPAMRILLALALLVPASAGAAERSVYFGSIDRLRVQGPYRVSVTAGSPRGTVRGDGAAINEVDVHVDGTTLVIRPRSASASPSGSEPVAVEIATPNLSTANVAGSAAVTIAAMKGDRVDLAVSGPGSIEVAQLDAAHASATLLGTGRIALAGRAGEARLVASGEGAIDAGKLDAGELLVHHDGNGEIAAAARFTAQVSNTGLGQVSVAGTPKCRVAGGGPVSCGTPPR